MTETDNVVDQLRKIIKVSTRIRQDQMRKILKMNEDTFNEQIISWACEFGFKIDGDYVTFSEGDTDAFIAALNAQFQDWGTMEQTGAGKYPVTLLMCPPPATGPPQSGGAK